MFEREKWHVWEMIEKKTFVKRRWICRAVVFSHCCPKTKLKWCLYMILYLNPGCLLMILTLNYSLSAPVWDALTRSWRLKPLWVGHGHDGSYQYRCRDQYDQKIWKVLIYWFNWYVLSIYRTPVPYYQIDCLSLRSLRRPWAGRRTGVWAVWGGTRWWTMGESRWIKIIKKLLKKTIKKL